MSSNLGQLAQQVMRSCPARVVRTAPATFGLSAGSILFYAISAQFNLLVSLRENFGLDPDQPLSYFTHFLLHANRSHIGRNVFYFVVLGPFAEIWLGRLRYFILCISVGVSLGALSVVLLPDYFPADLKPIGFSGVTYFACTAGLYSSAMIVSSRRCRLRWLSTASAFVLDSKLSQFAVPALRCAGVFLALLCLVVVVRDDWEDPDSAARLVHALGALAGVAVGLIDLSIRGRTRY